MYRCIAKLEIDLEGLGEFYSDVGELTMYQIISAWLQDDLDGPNPENTVFGVSEYALDWMAVLPGDISYRNLFDMGSCKLGNRSESIDYIFRKYNINAFLKFVFGLIQRGSEIMMIASQLFTLTQGQLIFSHMCIISGLENSAYR